MLLKIQLWAIVSKKEFKIFGCPKKHKSKKAIEQHKHKYADLILLY